MLAYAKTDIGLIRETNEDNYAFAPPHLYVVADGMGGHVAGEIASKHAVNEVKEYINNHIDQASPDILLEQAINQANQVVYQLAQSKNEYQGMGTTVTAVYIDEEVIYWAHVGDSRIYLLHDETIEQLTNDHSLVSELVQSGSITMEEAHTHPQRNILTRAVGIYPQIKIDRGKFNWKPNDSILLCTDGLTNMINEQAIYLTIKNGENDGSEIVEKLIEQAKNAGGFDNITAILVKYGDA